MYSYNWGREERKREKDGGKEELKIEEDWKRKKYWEGRLGTKGKEKERGWEVGVGE